MVPETSVSAGYARAVITVAVARGADAAMLTSQADMTPATLDDPDARIPFTQFRRLMQAAKHLCSDPAFGLHFGAESRFEEISIVGLLCHAAPTMGAAFEEMNRFARLAVEVDGHAASPRFALVHDDGAVWLVDQRRNPNDFPELTEATMARFICDTRRHYGRVPFAKAVHVTHAAPAYRADYDQILGVATTFDSDRNAILIDESWLSLPIPSANRYVFGILSDHASALLTSLEGAQSVAGQVEALLIPILHSSDVGIARIARTMAVSRATLYRKLRAEQTSFAVVLDRLRHQMAVHYLTGGKVSVNETAYLVGYTDPAAFSRAFKRWTGVSPREAANRARLAGDQPTIAIR